MPNFTTEQLRAAMANPQNIRNMSVIAHVDSGKSTLSDCLVQKAGIISYQSAGEERATDTRSDEKERGITIKSTGVSMAFDYKPDQIDNPDKPSEQMLINLIDSPGHVDFSSEVTSALRITDGSLIVLDCIEGVMVQTKTVLRQSLQEKCKPVLMMNKLDRVIIEQKMNLVDAFHKLRNVIEDVNLILADYNDEDLGNLTFDPRDGTVAFGSAAHQWAFTLGDFATMHALRMTKKDVPDYTTVLKQTRDTLLKYMWGNYYYSKETNKFTKTKPTPESQPVFCEFVLKYLYEVINGALDNNTEVVDKIIKRYNIKLLPDEKVMKERHLAKALMRNWLPMSDCVLRLIIEKLPSPAVAQKYRTKYLYTGPQDDEVATAMANCDAYGPVMMYVSKIIPEKEGSDRFYAFGRLFSGTIKTGESYKIMGPNHVFGTNSDVTFASAQRVVTLMASRADTMSEIPCGNTCALLGVDKYLVKTGTISSFKEAHLIRDMKFSVSPVVQVCVAPKNGAMLPKLLDALNKIRKTDPMCLVFRDNTTKENIVAGSGELHMEILIHDLRAYMGDNEIIVTEPIVSYRETVAGTTATHILAKSKNGHNRAWVTVEPMNEELANDIESGVVVPKPKDQVTQTRMMVKKYSFDPEDCGKRMWGHGPTDDSANMFLNSTVGIVYLDTVRESMKSGFCEATEKGPLMNEPVRGAIFRVHDVKLHPDSVHRGTGEIQPMTRSACYGAMLNSDPRVMEPMYECSISIPSTLVGTIYTVLCKRRGEIFFDQLIEGTPMNLIKAHLPVKESFGFDAELKACTSGQAFMQNSFSHYQVINEDPYDETTLAHAIVMEVRNRKRIGTMPTKEYYVDKL